MAGVTGLTGRVCETPRLIVCFEFTGAGGVPLVDANAAGRKMAASSPAFAERVQRFHLLTVLARLLCEIGP